MPFERRSVYELGDDDPAAADERRDHGLAPARGRRLTAITGGIVSALMAGGLVRDPETATAVIFSTLADHLYGNHAIDIPGPRGGGE